ncbi:hypothetical protein MJT46_010412 [Ovis ammon polii x Ovis aries]|nr:hypothetical protein MJT46_010412 [Ovis ammon polii x Ovis aries]
MEVQSLSQEDSTWHGAAKSGRPNYRARALDHTSGSVCNRDAQSARNYTKFFYIRHAIGPSQQIFIIEPRYCIRGSPLENPGVNPEILLAIRKEYEDQSREKTITPFDRKDKTLYAQPMDWFPLGRPSEGHPWSTAGAWRNKHGESRQEDQMPQAHQEG